MNCFSLKAKNVIISRTSKLLETYGLDGLEPQQFPKLSYPDNPEVVSSYSFQIYAKSTSKPKNFRIEDCNKAYLKPRHLHC